jgi:hypothetical protein
MSKSKSNALLVTFSVMLTGISITGLLQSPQTVHSQQDYEEYMVTETNNEQKLKQENTGLSKESLVDRYWFMVM